MKNAAMIRIRFIRLLLIMILIMGASSAFAITWGTEDESGVYSNVCMMGMSFDGIPLGICSGVLIHERVVLTAGHCIEYVGSLEQIFGPGNIDVEVLFGFNNSYPDVGPGDGLPVEDYYAHPDYYWGPQSNPHDIGVLILADPVTDRTPAELPTEGLLDELKAAKVLSKGSNKAKFTVVGYGGSLEWPPPVIDYYYKRQYAESEYRALLPAWLRLSQNQATGDGGSCFGDSGGPVFWSDDNGDDILVGITSWGDPNCISPSFNYRIDIPESLNFIYSVLNLVDGSED
jgi:secreted trypsin-like serine protease